jgi:hypothetical protein
VAAFPARRRRRRPWLGAASWTGPPVSAAKGRLRLLPGRPPLFLPSFSFPLPLPFSGGGDWIWMGKKPGGGGTGMEDWGSIYRAARLGFQASGWTAAILGIRAQGHAAPIRLGRWGDRHGGRRGSPAPTRCVTGRKKSRGVRGCGG